MSSLNKVFLMGNLTRDPELRYTPSGAAVASFGLAINRKYKLGDEWKEEICFVEITTWNKMAENCAGYLNKGRGVLVEGRLSYRTWEAQDGQKRSKLDVVASNVQFLPRNMSDNDSLPEQADLAPVSKLSDNSTETTETSIEEANIDVPF